MLAPKQEILGRPARFSSSHAARSWWTDCYTHIVRLTHLLGDGGLPVLHLRARQWPALPCMIIYPVLCLTAKLLHLRTDVMSFAFIVAH